MPFLTDLDPRAAVKGSRDPLGLQPVWSRFGRQVVGNLTTVSGSVRGFTTLLLGHYFAERVHEVDGRDTHSTLDLFLTFEQLAGYSRWHVNKDRGFRGTERVVARSSSSKVTIGSALPHQILSSQKTYGLWGLFSVPARESGLRMLDDAILTSAASEFVEKRYVTKLTSDGLRAGKPIIDLLRRDPATVSFEGREAAIVKAVAGLLSHHVSAPERTFYWQHLANGGDEDKTRGCQPMLATLLRGLPANVQFGLPELKAIIKQARKAPGGEVLTERLEAISDLEALLIPMANAFGFTLTRARQTPSAIAGEIKKVWGPRVGHINPDAIAMLRPAIAAAYGNESKSADRLLQIATAFAHGDYQSAIDLLLEHNAVVMRSRYGSQPWARVVDGKLDVRYPDESASLMARDELPHAWRNTYFINALKDVVVELGGA